MIKMSNAKTRQLKCLKDDNPSLALQIKEKGLRKPGKPRFIFI